jgi:hypothetical protein
VFKRSVLDMIAEELMREGPETAERAVPIGAGAVPIITDPQVGPCCGQGACGDGGRVAGRFAAWLSPLLGLLLRVAWGVHR